MSIRDQKLLYHLTGLNNMNSILKYGLLPRGKLQFFEDVADAGILEGRKEFHLDEFVPFHWFARNPFDGRVQTNHPQKHFVLISVRRTIAEAENWRVVPEHPLSKQAPQIFDYEKGFSAIDWDTMELRDYRNARCKSVCMAECLSPRPVVTKDFFRIYVRSKEVEEKIVKMMIENRIGVSVEVNPKMFNP